MSTRRPRRALFALLPALLFFGGLELALALSPGAVVPRMTAGDGDGHLYVGHSVAQPYLVRNPAETEWVPHRQEMSLYSSLPVASTPGRLRVGTAGGSTMATEQPQGPAWQLYALLTLGSAGGVDLVNLGGNGFGSTRVLGAARDALSKDLDALVVYAGHNEFTESRYIPALRTYRALGERLGDSWRTAAWVGSWLRHWQGRPLQVAEAVPDGPMRPGEEQALLARYRDNLDALARSTQAGGATAVWVLPASNLAVAPGASAPSPGESLSPALQARLDAASEALRRGDATRAATEAAAVVDQAPGHAQAWYLQGLSASRKGDSDTALASLRTARDLDRAPVRATQAMRDVMQQVANAHDVALIDAEALLITADRGRYLSGGFSVDAMHLDATGYRLVAEAVYAALRAPLGLADPDPAAMPPPGSSLAPILGAPRRTVASDLVDTLGRKPPMTAPPNGR